MRSEQTLGGASRDEVDRIVASAAAWCEAWNRHDMEAILAHYTEDVAFSSPTVVTRWGLTDGWLHGREALRAHFARGLAVPGLRFDFVNVLIGVGSMCLLYRRETGALVCDLAELAVDGRYRRVVACYGTPPSAPG